MNPFQCLHSNFNVRPYVTSGIVVLGRNRAAHKSLSVQFQDRVVSKQYKALVHGWPDEDQGTVDVGIGKWRGGVEGGGGGGGGGSGHAVMRVAGPGVTLEGARAALTGWEVLERCERSDGVSAARQPLPLARYACHPTYLSPLPYLEFNGNL